MGILFIRPKAIFCLLKGDYRFKTFLRQSWVLGVLIDRTFGTQDDGLFRRLGEGGTLEKCDCWSTFFDTSCVGIHLNSTPLQMQELWDLRCLGPRFLRLQSIPSSSFTA